MKNRFQSVFLSLFLLISCSYADIHYEINNANLLLYQGKYTEAEKAYTQLIAPAANEFIVGSILVDSLHINRAISRLLQQNIKAAHEDIEAAFHPQSSMMYDDSGYMLRARMRLMEHDEKGAFEDYNQLIENSKKGMANDYRFAFAMAQRAWAYLVVGQTDAARKDFLSAIATDTTMLGMDMNPMQKPFWQAVVNEIIPLVESNNMLAIHATLDAILERQQIKALPFSPTVSIEKKNFANTILLYEIYGPAFLLKDKSQKEHKQVYQENVNVLFTSAQQALLKGDKQGAFNTFVRAFQSASNEDRKSRDNAVQGMAGIIHSGFTPPLMNETTRRLAIKAQVITQEKAYQEAIQIYWQAIKEAPWVANLYYDHALLVAEVANKADDYNVAITEMKRFISLSSNAAEKREAQDRIYQWEVKRDRSALKIPQAPYVARNATAGSSDCFIATAAFGSFLDPHVVTLRHFRDRFLLSNTLGQWFVERYYTYSPTIAQTIRENEFLQFIVRLLLIPFVISIEYPIWIVTLTCLLLLLKYTKRRFSVL